jgi:myo-inositol-1(or 4)-monophosphatase
MLNIAIKAARAAGSIINRASLDLDLLQVTVKNPNDFVTEVDQAAEAAIIDILLQAYPGHGILAEESGRAHGAKDSEFTWIIDPLDGTTNFIHGFPVYAVSIALAHRGVVQQAVVYDPARNDLFMASKGRGAYLNDRRLRVSKRARLADSLIGTGFPFRKGDSFKRYVKMFEDVMTQCAGLRRPGAAALDLCYVAAGFYDGFFETGLNPWDIAAGSLIITEAGGLIGNFTGEADFMYQREVVAGNPKIYGQLVQILGPYSRVLKDGEATPKGEAGAGTEGAALDATEAFVAAVDSATAAEGDAANAPAPAPKERKPIRIVRPRPVEGEAEGAPATERPRGPRRDAPPSGPRRDATSGARREGAGPRREGSAPRREGTGPRRDGKPAPRKTPR